MCHSFVSLRRFGNETGVSLQETLELGLCQCEKGPMVSLAVFNDI